MAGFRAYYSGEALPEAGGQITLDDPESHHLVKVRRAVPGAHVSAFDGMGREWDGHLEEARPKAAVIRVEAYREIALPAPAMTLGISMLKGKTMDLVIQKATELGVSKIVGLGTDNSEVRLDPGKVAGRIEKWRQIAIESCKQCGNSFIPEFAADVPLGDFLRPDERPALKLIAALTPETVSVSEAVDEMPGSPRCTAVRLLVGPEGDFSPPEYQAAFLAGFRPVTLGPNVLRADTAAIALMAIAGDTLRACKHHPEQG